VLDDDLVAEAMRLTGITTKREVVRAALKHLVRAKRRRPLGDLWGKLRFAPGFDYKAVRRSPA
jgi:Arc/MetJ family transcription regulator